MHFQYVTISRGGTSIIEKLKQLGIDPDQYISWFSLRNFGRIKVSKTTQATYPPTAAATGASLPNDSGSVFGDGAAIKNPFDDQLSRLNTNTSTTSASLTTLHPDPTPTSRRGSAASSTHSAAGVPEVDDDRYDYVSELLYLHDKLMIVDDRIVLMGSGRTIVLS